MQALYTGLVSHVLFPLHEWMKRHDTVRVRLGIGHPGSKDAVSHFVLSDFAKADQDWLDDLMRGISDGAVALAAGDHNGSTLYQHQRFNAVVRGAGEVEVTLNDGLAAVMMGLAAQESARTGQAISLLDGDFSLKNLLSKH